jgi:hypothetical protein
MSAQSSPHEESSRTDAVVVLGLISANLLAFVVGHGYRHSAVE